MNFKSLFVGLGIVAAALTSPAKAQEICDWKPTKTMRLVVTTGAGTAFDVLARAAANHWEKYFGVDLIVQNVTGGGGTLGIDDVMKARDANTIGLMPSVHYLDQLVQPAFPWKPSDIPIFLGIDTPPVGVLTGTESGYETWEQVRESDKRVIVVRFQGLTYDMPLLVDLAEHGVDIATASFDSFAPIMSSIQSGDGQLWSSVLSLTAMDQVKEGTMRVLYVYADERLPDLPDVPTHKELGMPENWISTSVSRMFFAPPETDEGTLDCMNKRLNALLDDPEIYPWAVKNGIIYKIVSGEKTRKDTQGLYEIIDGNKELFEKYGG